MGKKISQEMPTASWNDAAPILSVLLELVSLEWIDLVADQAGNRQLYSQDWPQILNSLQHVTENRASALGDL
jgi:hypothetical protein